MDSVIAYCGRIYERNRKLEEESLLTQYAFSLICPAGFVSNCVIPLKHDPPPKGSSLDPG